MEDNIKKVIVILLSTIGAVAIIGSLTQVLLISPLHSTMAQQQQQQNVIQSSSIDPLPSSPSSSSSLANVFKKVENSVVQITSTRSNP
ncbi:MAG TPA: hypothetical protein VFJ51_05440, partial [Nitrososphaeraceae archaeon]|nr:hypothetical protein [Nitrososphaeraceae archaeon]